MIACLIDHYAHVEALYLRQPSAIFDKLEGTIVRLYAAAMQYLAQAKRYFEQHTASK